MNIKKICELLNAKVVCGEHLMDTNIEYAFASDLMSDVLTLDVNNILLITGLSNMQTMRTAEMAEIACILFVRGKKITEDMIKLGKENDMILLECNYSMFKAIGILYENHLKPVY